MWLWSLTLGWLVFSGVGDYVVADESVQLLHRYRTPDELHCITRDLLHVHHGASRGRWTSSDKSREYDDELRGRTMLELYFSWQMKTDRYDFGWESIKIAGVGSP